MTNEELMTELKKINKNIYNPQDKFYFISTKGINEYLKYLSYYDVFCEEQE